MARFERHPTPTHFVKKSAGVSFTPGRRGFPGMGDAEVQAIADANDAALVQVIANSQQVVTDSAVIVDDYGNLVTLAQQAQAAANAVPDESVSMAVDNPASLTAAALEMFVAKVQPWIDPHVEHGAVGDGVTDDATALQLACNAASNGTLRKTVKLRRGHVYRIGTHVTITGDMHLDANGATIKPLASSTMRALQITSPDVLVTDLLVDMNRAETVNGGSTGNQQGVLINAAGADISDVTLRRVHVINSHQRGIVAQAGGGFTLNDITVEHCLVADVGERGIHIGGGGSATNRGVRVTGCKVLRPVQYGIICQGVGDARVTGCEVVGDATSTNSGIVMSATGAVSRDWSVTDCTVAGFAAASRWGIVATVGAQRFTIAGNIVRDCAGGITVDPEDGAAPGVEVGVAATVTGNTVAGTLSSHGINVRMCSGATVTGNTVEDVYDRGVAVSSATGCTVTGNSIARTGSDGIGLFGTTSGGGHAVGPNVVRDWGTLVSALAVRDLGTPIDNAFVTTSTTP